MEFLWLLEIEVMTESQENLTYASLSWYHNEPDGVSNHRCLDCLNQSFVQAQIKENMKAPHQWPLWGNTGRRRIPLIKGQKSGKRFHLTTLPSSLLCVASWEIMFISQLWCLLLTLIYWLPRWSKRFASLSVKTYIGIVFTCFSYSKLQLFAKWFWIAIHMQFRMFNGCNVDVYPRPPTTKTTTYISEAYSTSLRQYVGPYL